MPRRPVGWRREPARHALAARGVRTRGAITVRGGLNAHSEDNPFIEFVCHNTDFPDSTSLERISALARDLNKLQGVEVLEEDWSYLMQDNGEQVSLRAIITGRNKRELAKQIRLLAKKRGVQIDLEVDTK